MGQDYSDTKSDTDFLKKKKKKNFYRPVSFMNIDVQILNKSSQVQLTVNEKDNTSFAFPGIQSWFSI